jgi:hypothetical protein
LIRIVEIAGDDSRPETETARRFDEEDREGRNLVNSPTEARPQKHEDPPAPRQLDLERLLCQAIRQRVLLQLKYEDDAFYRSFESNSGLSNFKRQDLRLRSAAQERQRPA